MDFITIGLLIINIIIVAAVKFNDLKHIAIKLDKIELKVEQLAERVSTLEGRTEK